MGGARTRTPISRNGNLCMTQMDESRWRISYATPRIPRNSGRKGMNEPQRLLLCSGHTVFALSPAAALRAALRGCQTPAARGVCGCVIYYNTEAGSENAALPCTAGKTIAKQTGHCLSFVCASPSARIYHAFTFSSM